MSVSKKSTAELLIDLNVSDETESIEVKSISGEQLGKSVFETICAFANEPGLEGGIVLLGVNRESEALFPHYAVSGVQDPDKISADLVTGCQEKFNTPIRPKVSTEIIEGKAVIRVEVSEASGGAKPLYLKAAGLPKGAYRRLGSVDVKCTDEDLYALFSAKTEEPFDSRVAEDADTDDLDPDSVELYRSSRRQTAPDAVELAWSDDDLLYALRAVKKVNSSVRPTNAGVLVFGSSMALRRLAPSQRVDYIRVPGRTWVEDPDKRFETIEMRGSVLALVPRVIAAVLDDLPRSFAIDANSSPQRADKPALPSDVIREAVVNALMHRSYQTFQPIQVIRYANRLEIRNPGYSLKNVERFEDPGSTIRNPAIAEILHETRYAENKGSGVRVMRAKMLEAGLGAPTFKSDRENDQFISIFLFHHFLDAKDVAWLANFKEFGLSDEQLRALIFVREVQAIDNRSLRDQIKLDTLGASKVLTSLRSLGLLVEKGGGSQTYYVPGPILEPFLAMEASSASMEPRLDDSGVNIQPTDAIRVPDLPQPLARQLTHLKLKKRLQPEEQRAMIIELCDWKPLSATQISDLLGKQTKYIAQHFLSPMIKDGLLVYTHPEMINHPQQKYKKPQV